MDSLRLFFVRLFFNLDLNMMRKRSRVVLGQNARIPRLMSEIQISRFNAFDCLCWIENFIELMSLNFTSES